METKLTLRLNDGVIERAKIYARNQKISLSKMIESYLDHLTREKENVNQISITPLVKSLSGIIDDKVWGGPLVQQCFSKS